MKQRHSYTNLLYHIVMCTKNRQHLITTSNEERALNDWMKYKSHQLDAWLVEFGCWFDHVHILLRTGPNISLSKIYRQIKGFSAWSWNKRWPHKAFGWSDGVFAASVDPGSTEAICQYILNQKSHHHMKTIVASWETDFPSC